MLAYSLFSIPLVTAVWESVFHHLVLLCIVCFVFIQINFMCLMCFVVLFVVMFFCFIMFIFVMFMLCYVSCRHVLENRPKGQHSRQTPWQASVFHYLVLLCIVCFVFILIHFMCLLCFAVLCLSVFFFFLFSCMVLLCLCFVCFVFKGWRSVISRMTRIGRLRNNNLAISQHSR